MIEEIQGRGSGCLLSTVYCLLSTDLRITTYWGYCHACRRCCPCVTSLYVAGCCSTRQSRAGDPRRRGGDRQEKDVACARKAVSRGPGACPQDRPAGARERRQSRRRGSGDQGDGR